MRDLEKKLKIILKEFQSLRELCLSCQKILTEEEKVLRAHNLDELELVNVEKERLFTLFQRSIVGLFDNSEIIFSAYSDFRVSQEQQVNLSKFVDFFLFLKEKINSDENYRIGAEKNRILSLVDLLIAEGKEIIRNFTKIKTAVSKNRYVVSTLLSHHQESYRFWSDLVRDKKASYSSKGEKLEQKSISQLSVRA